jgi:hypothetical protein
MDQTTLTDTTLTDALVQIETQVRQQELLDDFNAIQMARTPEVLKRFVVGAQAIDHPAQGWAQCVLEMQIKYDDIRRAKLHARLVQLEIEQLESVGDEKSSIEADIKRIDLEAQTRAMLGAIREFQSLYEIYRNYGRRYSREELNASQVDYWQNRLTRQAVQDKQSRALGIGAGNLQALLEANIEPQNLPAQLPSSSIDDIIQTESRFLSTAAVEPEADDAAAVQQRYLDTGKQRMLIVTLTADSTQPASVPVLEREYYIPATVERKFHCIYGMTIDRGYTDAVFHALRDGATHLMCIEDDTYPPLDAIERLLAHDKDIVCGWYPKRQPGKRVGVPIVLQNGKRQSLDNPDDYTELVELYTAPMGCTLIKTDVFRRIQMPWFVTTGQLTQDSFFSQKAREAGYTLWCDTSIRCEHKDRDTGVVYV